MKTRTCRFTATYIFLLFCFCLEARVIRLQSNANETIAGTVNRSSAGDTVIIPAGIYKESTITIDKPLYFLGENFPVLDGQGKFEILDIKSDHVTISGFKFQNSGRSDATDMAALKVFNCRFITIRNNIFEQAYFSIYLQGSKQCFVYNNFIRGVEASEMMAGNGIHCWYCDSLRIFQNRITTHRDGIYFEFVTNSEILGNYSYNNVRYGLHFMFSHNDTYTSNIFEANGAGVAVMYTKGVHMLHNTFRYNWGAASYGLLLKDISDSEIQGNTFEENTVALHVEGGSRMRISGNEFISNGWAAQMQASCMDNVVTKNNFIGNSFDIATNGNLVLSTFDGNYWDKYEGYDLQRDGLGDVPYRPVSLYAVIVEKVPAALMLYRSPITSLMDKAEKVIPGMTPVELLDNKPAIKSIDTRYD